MPRVKNLSTGLEWPVPAGHFSLDHPGYVVLRDKPKGEPSKPPARKRASTKKE